MNTPSPQTRYNACLPGLLTALVLIAVLCPTASAEEELGRLFFTPERRQNLDRQRQLNIQEKQVVPEEPSLTINGVVTRSSGKRTVWINGVAQDNGHADGGVAVTPSRANPGKVVIRPEGGPATTAGIGDTFNRTTGEATELLQGGRIVIRRPNPAR